MEVVLGDGGVFHLDGVSDLAELIMEGPGKEEEVPPHDDEDERRAEQPETD